MRQEVYPANTKPLSLKVYILLLYLLFPIQAFYAQPTSLPPEMVYIRGGTFEMGCTAEQSTCSNDENPVHEVTLNDFYLGKYEVTQAQWASIAPEYTPNYNVGQGNNHPVYRISWYEAATFCNRLSLLEGYTPAYYFDQGFTEPFDTLLGTAVLSGGGEADIFWDISADGYRLPTEAEWEYAARGGELSQGYEFSGSSDANEVAWFGNNSGNTTKPTGTKMTNELGLHDMSGNVSEWCWDFKSDTYYSSSLPCSPLGPDGNGGKVRRGGSWFDPASSCRVANRDLNAVWYRFSLIGFRLARTP